jgi:hypothetical protein
MSIHRTALLALSLAAALAAAAPAAAQSVEVGGWLARNYSSESTHGIPACIDPDPARCTRHAAPLDGRRATAGALSVRLQRERGIGLRGELALVPKGYSPPTHPYISSLYLEAPLLAEVGTEPADPVSLFLAAGLAPSVLLRCSISDRTDAGLEQTACGESRASGIAGTRRFDLGGVYSGGVRVRAGSGTAYLEVRAVNGLIDARPGREGRTLNSTSALMAGFTLRVR